MEGYRKSSEHHIQFLTLPGRHWKWRMHGAAVTLAEKFLADRPETDLLLFTDMLDVTTFLSLTRKVTANLPTAIYFHENQISYPKSRYDSDLQAGRDNHYAFINYTSALCCDQVLFNSSYHRESFLRELGQIHSKYPDYRELDSITRIGGKSRVLHLGLDLKRLDISKEQKRNEPPIILWNHRWEYDKNPEEFFRAMKVLRDRKLSFNLAILGEKFRTSPPIFNEIQDQLADRLLHFGFVQSYAAYASWLWRSSLLPITSRQDFFGASIMEAVYCKTIPLLPNRLTYPELLPEAFHKDCIYVNFEELLTKLENMLLNPGYPATELAASAAKYDWSVMAPVYDRCFEEIVS